MSTARLSLRLSLPRGRLDQRRSAAHQVPNLRSNCTSSSALILCTVARSVGSGSTSRSLAASTRRCSACTSTAERGRQGSVVTGCSDLFPVSGSQSPRQTHFGPTILRRRLLGTVRTCGGFGWMPTLSRQSCWVQHRVQTTRSLGDGPGPRNPCDVVDRGSAAVLPKSRLCTICQQLCITGVPFCISGAPRAYIGGDGLAPIPPRGSGNRGIPNPSVSKALHHDTRPDYRCIPDRRAGFPDPRPATRGRVRCPRRWPGASLTPRSRCASPP